MDFFRKNWRDQGALNVPPSSMGGAQQQAGRTQGRGGTPTSFISEASGLGGALAGGAAGATIGSVVPGIGTVIGGLIGAGLGGLGGGFGGSALEQRVRDDEVDWGQAAREGAIEGAFSLGPLRAGKAVIGGAKALRAGQAVLPAAGEAALKSLLKKGTQGAATKSYLQAFDIPNRESLVKRLQPDKTAQELMNYRIGGSLDNIQQRSQGVLDILGRTVTDTASAVGGDIRTGDIVGIANRSLRTIPVPERQKAALLNQVSDIGADGLIPDRISPIDALERARGLKNTGYQYIAEGTSKINPKRDVAELGRAYLLVADELEDSLYKAVDNRGLLEQFKTPERITELNNLARGLGDKLAGAKNLQEVRSLMRPFVSANDMAQITTARGATATGTGIMDNLGARGAGGAIGFGLGGPIGAAAGFLGAPLLRAAGETVQSPIATAAGRTLSRVAGREAGERAGRQVGSMTVPRGIAPRALAGSAVNTAVTTAQSQSQPQQPPQSLEDALLQQSEVGQFDQDSSGLSGMSQQEPFDLRATLLQDLQQTGGKNIDDIAKTYQLLGGKLPGDDDPQLTAQQRNSSIQYMNAENLINNLESEFANAGGARGRIGGAIGNLAGRAGIDSNVAAYNDLRNAATASIARALGETGNMSDSDIRRAVAAIPSITDTPQQAARKLAFLRTQLQAAASNALANPMAQQPSSMEQALMRNQGVF